MDPSAKSFWMGRNRGFAKLGFAFAGAFRLAPPSWSFHAQITQAQITRQALTFPDSLYGIETRMTSYYRLWRSARPCMRRFEVSKRLQVTGRSKIGHLNGVMTLYITCII